jgi:hypothetical protein
VDSTYHSGRNRDWLKVTCRHRDTFYVAGIAESAASSTASISASAGLRHPSYKGLRDDLDWT